MITENIDETILIEAIGATEAEIILGWDDGTMSWTAWCSQEKSGC